ncbi:MAG: zinc ribbon domain-containing protein [Chloroflexi bacterium]|nr:zinc ribbon domain-containing protein [Chloroflexota bacterium]
MTLSVSSDLLDDSPRCPRCGKRNLADAAQCAACGYDFIPRRARIQCGHCGRRVPTDETICAYCGNDPHSSRFPFALRVIAIFLFAILIGCMGWAAIRVFIVIGATAPENLEALTPPVQVIIVVVTNTPVSTPLPTFTPPPTSTTTPRFSPTPTRRGTRTVTIAPTATPIPPPYAAPKLSAPLNATIYDNVDAPITLEWQAVSATTLRENEWYLIAVSYTARDGKPATRKGWSKETQWSVIKDWYADISPTARTLSWNVTVMRVEGADPLSSNSTPGSPPSATRTFIWK